VVRRVEISPDDTTIVAAVYDHAILWDVKTGKIKYTFYPPHFEQDVNGNLAAFLADGKQVMVAGLNTMSLWNADTGNLIWSFSTGRGVDDWWLSAKGKKFLTDGDPIEAGPPQTVLWDLTTGQKIRELEGFAKGLSPDGKYVLVEKDGKLILLSTDENKVLSTYDVDEGHSPLFSSDNKYIAVINGKRERLILDTEKGKVLDNFGVYWYAIPAFLPKEQFLIVTDGLHAETQTSLHIYDIPSGKETQTIQIPNEVPRTIDLSEDGKSLLAGTQSGTVTLWNIQSGKLIRRFC
jgi:WD40 repeat protein